MLNIVEDINLAIKIQYFIQLIQFLNLADRETNMIFNSIRPLFLILCSNIFLVLGNDLPEPRLVIIGPTGAGTRIGKIKRAAF